MSAHAGRENRSMKHAENKSLEQAIESAIVVSWTDLMRGAQTGLIHVEYGFAPTGRGSPLFDALCVSDTHQHEYD